MNPDEHAERCAAADREEARLFLVMLRAAGVVEWDGKVPPWTGEKADHARVRFEPSRPAPVADEERALPKPPRSFDTRLFGPLGIGKEKAPA